MHIGGTFANAYGQDGMDAGGISSAENVFPILWGLAIEIEMGVRVDQGHRPVFRVLQLMSDLHLGGCRECKPVSICLLGGSPYKGATDQADVTFYE